jgi:type I restriction enzyme S subunit
MLGSVKGGKRLPKGACLVATNTGHPYLRIVDLKDGTVDRSNIRYVPSNVWPKIQRYTISHGDVYITIVGSIGEAGTIPADLDRANLTENAAKITGLSGVVPEYVALWLRSTFCQALIQDNIHSAGQGKLALFRIEKLPIPVPPFEEQERIASKVKALLVRIRAAQERLDKIPTIIKRFRQAVLAAACNGNLTADWRGRNPNSETAQELISHVGQRRRESLDGVMRTAAKRRAITLNDFDNLQVALRDDLELSDLPETWQWVDLRFVMTPEEPFCYGVVQPGADDPRGPKLIRVCDMAGGRVLRENLRGIPPSVHSQYQRSVLRGGEVLVSLVGTIGRPAIAPPDLAGANIARAVAKIPVREFDARFILLWLSSSQAEAWMVGDAREVARKTLNLEQLRTLPVPLAPLPEQQEIVRRVEKMFTLADRLQMRYENAKAQVERLTQSVLAKAFRGELVPTEAELARRESREYETAAQLLARIRATNEAQRVGHERQAKRTTQVRGV